MRGRAGYLIGEKLLNFLRAADEDPAFAGELPRFVTEIKQIFDHTEIETYLDTVHRVGALGHVSSDDAYEEMREAGAMTRIRSSGPRTSSASSARRCSCSPEAHRR